MPHPGLSAVVGRWRTEGRVLGPEPVRRRWSARTPTSFSPAAHSGDVPTGGAVRATLTVARDGASMRALWERADDGMSWEPWMDIGFSRLA